MILNENDFKFQYVFNCENENYVMCIVFFMMLFYCFKINLIMFIYKFSFNLNLLFFIYEKKKIICGGKNQNKFKMNMICDVGNLYKVFE